MANIKFSAFTQKAASADVDFLVGYTGADNVRVAPSVFDNVYLPLAGGTMTGDIVFNDNIKARFGTGLDAYIEHDGTNTYIVNATGSLDVRAASNFVIKNSAGSENILIATPNGAVKLYYDAAKKLETTSVGATLTGALSITGDGSNAATLTESGAGLLTIATVDDFVVDAGGDIILDAEGGDIRLKDAGVSKLTISMQGGGDTYFVNETNNADILFKGVDDTSTITALTLDMSEAGNAIFGSSIFLADSKYAYWGNANDFYIGHNGGNTYLLNSTGNIEIANYANDKDIIFQSDDGSGGTATYFFLDGGTSETNDLITTFPDYSNLCFGDGRDFKIYHDTTDTTLKNQTGHLYIVNTSDDKSIYFQTDDGGGGITTYMKVDGLSEYTQFDKPARFMDNVYCQFGNSNDSDIYHNGTDMFMRNYATDGDIRFYSDNGSGGIAEYFRLDGGNMRTEFGKNIKFDDNVKALFGTGNDLEIYHDGSNSYIDETGTGDLVIKASNNMFFESAAGASKIVARTGGALDLYHNGSKKIETTSTGTLTTGQMDIAALNTAPASASAAGTLGEIRYTADYIYVCTATNTWKRAALSTW